VVTRDIWLGTAPLVEVAEEEEEEEGVEEEGTGTKEEGAGEDRQTSAATTAKSLDISPASALSLQELRLPLTPSSTPSFLSSYFTESFKSRHACFNVCVDCLRNGLAFNAVAFYGGV